MLLPGRHANTSDYRYGFQGQELDNEIKGEGNSHNYTFRMHDPRVGRFFATDPLEKSYPMLTPYQFASNRVIDFLEIEGLEGSDTDLWLEDRHQEKLRTLKGKELEEYMQLRGKMTIGITIGFIDATITRGAISMSIAGGGLLEGINESERGYEALERGDYDEAQRRFDNAGEATKDVIFEIVGAGLAKGVGKGISYAAEKVAKIDYFAFRAFDDFKNIDDIWPGCDCSEIAEEIYKATNNGGEIIEFRGIGGKWINAKQSGYVDSFDYHQVYVKEGYVYDPRYSDGPVLYDDYFEELRKVNPEGIEVSNVAPPED